VTTAPNQLWNAAVIVGTKLYLPSISAAPAAPTNFQTNVHAVVYVGDLATHAEDRGRTARWCCRADPRSDHRPTTKQFLADIVDVDFVGTGVRTCCRAAATPCSAWCSTRRAGPQLGSPQNKQIELNTTPAGSAGPCHTPTGIVTATPAPARS
jgi:hypothetical protein